MIGSLRFWNGKSVFNLKEKLTLIIPTRNRHHFLIKTLGYYVKMKANLNIILADSSDPDIFDKNRLLVQSVSGHFPIFHQFYSTELGNQSIIAQCIEMVKTPYCMYTGDDDFLIPPALQKCIAFLDANKDYSLASGMGVRPIVHQVSPRRFEIFSVDASILQKNDAPLGSQRLLRTYHPSWAPNSFAIHRTEILRHAFVHADRLGLDADSYCDTFFEVAINGFFSIAGREAKFTDFLYLVMLKHDQQIYHVRPLKFFDKLTHEHFSGNLKKIAQWWTEEMVAREAIEKNKAQEIAEAVLLVYLRGKILSGKPREIFFGSSSAGKNRWEAMLRRGWHFIKSKRTHISLPALMSRRSVYHKDFMKIHQILTTEENIH